MKKLFLILLLLCLPTLALAQTSRNPCYTTQPTAAGVPNCIGVGADTPLPTTNNLMSTNAVTAVSTNTYTYTSDKDRELIFTHVVYVASATVGNRLVIMELLNASDIVVSDFYTTPVIAASQTRHILFMPGTFRESTFDAGGTVQNPFPAGMVVPIGYKLRIRDVSNISAADTMTIGYQLK